jgi:hypothetical protein
MDVDVDIPSAGNMFLAINTVNSPAIALGLIFSILECANKPMPLNLVKHHKVQLPSKSSKDMLRVLLSSGECDAHEYMVASFVSNVYFYLL